MLAAAVVFSDTDSTSCGECIDFFGHYLSPLNFVGAAMNIAGWYGGVALGAYLRGSRTFTDEDWIYGLISGSVGAFAFVAFWLLAS